MRKQVTEQLKTVLAETYHLALITQNFHWNVEGARFASLHAMFEEQYDALFEAVDEIAERIRALGEKAPGGFKAFAALSGLKDADGTLNENGMLAALEKAHTHVVASLAQAMRTAQEAEDEVSADMMTERLQAHEKTLWMLRATLQA